MFLDPLTSAQNQTTNQFLLANAGVSMAFAQPLAAAIAATDARFRLLWEDAVYAEKWVSEGMSFADIILRLTA